MSILMIPSGSNAHYYAVNTDEEKPSHSRLLLVNRQAEKRLSGPVLATAMLGGVGVSAFVLGKNAPNSKIIATLKALTAQAGKLFQGNTTKANMVQTATLAGTLMGAGVVATKAMQSRTAPVIVQVSAVEPIENKVSSLFGKVSSSANVVWNSALKPSLTWSVGLITGQFKKSYDNSGQLLSFMVGLPKKGPEKFAEKIGEKLANTIYP